MSNQRSRKESKIHPACQRRIFANFDRGDWKWA
jgi:hypothetical protein